MPSGPPHIPGSSCLVFIALPGGFHPDGSKKDAQIISVAGRCKGEIAIEETKLVAEPGNSVTVITRTFDAPRERVYRVYTDPELIPLWWGPKGCTNTVKEWEVKPGGSWRIIQRAPNGKEFAFRGVYHDVEPDRLVLTFEFEGMPGHVMLETVTFEEHDGKTDVRDATSFQSVEDRDDTLKSGMEAEAPKVMQRINDVLMSKVP